MISFPHSPLESQTDVLEPATVCTLSALAGSAESHAGGRIQNQGEIRLKTAADEFIQKPHGALAQPPAKSLVGQARIIKAIAEHQFAARKRRAHNFLQMLMPGCIHEQQFRQGREFPVG